LGDFKYKFGAEPWNTSNRYADCSSFTKLVFKREGITLPRTSREQAKKGRYVAKRNLAKGDLVFFDTDKNGSINHVGIYMGNGRFIHSSPINKVGFSNLSSGYWAKHYKTARRVR
jgi:cell wall-associated NlpC family hydrolase